jgi:hypothetical protein
MLSYAHIVGCVVDNLGAVRVMFVFIGEVGKGLHMYALGDSPVRSS